MRYIHLDSDDAIMFERYLQVLVSYRDRLPPEVAIFAEDPDRFRLDGAKTLHDAWLESLTVRESRRRDDHPSNVEISLRLLGQAENHLSLYYRGVARYAIHAEKAELGGVDSFHGDIYTHEVRLSDGERVIHEILFRCGSTIEIECETFRVEEERGEPAGRPNAAEPPREFGRQ